MYVHKMTFTGMLIAVLFVLAKNQKETKGPMNKQIIEHLYDGILLNTTNKCTTDMCNVNKSQKHVTQSDNLKTKKYIAI